MRAGASQSFEEPSQIGYKYAILELTVSRWRLKDYNRDVVVEFISKCLTHRNLSCDGLMWVARSPININDVIYIKVVIFCNSTFTGWKIIVIINTAEVKLTFDRSHRLYLFTVNSSKLQQAPQLNAIKELFCKPFQNGLSRWVVSNTGYMN